MSREDPPTFHRGQPIWWNVSASRSPRPHFVPAGREEQAGWIRGVQGDLVAIELMDDSRNMVSFIVPIDQVRPRIIP